MINRSEVPFFVDLSTDMWLSDFFAKWNQAKDAVEMFPTEQNKQRWNELNKIKKDMELIINGALITLAHKEENGKS
jgi:hypothetical protein